MASPSIYCRWLVPYYQCCGPTWSYLWFSYVQDPGRHWVCFIAVLCNAVAQRGPICDFLMFMIQVAIEFVSLQCCAMLLANVVLFVIFLCSESRSPLSLFHCSVVQCCGPTWSYLWFSYVQDPGRHWVCFIAVLCNAVAQRGPICDFLIFRIQVAIEFVSLQCCAMLWPNVVLFVIFLCSGSRSPLSLFHCSVVQCCGPTWSYLWFSYVQDPGRHWVCFIAVFVIINVSLWCFKDEVDGPHEDQT